MLIVRDMLTGDLVGNAFPEGGSFRWPGTNSTCEPAKAGLELKRWDEGNLILHLQTYTIERVTTGEGTVETPGAISYDAENDRVVQPVTLSAAVVTADDVRLEARRRILGRYADWKQANMLARVSELQEKRLGGESLTTEEAAERDALQAAWDWIKSVRAASNVMEADPPADYTADSHWPE